MLHTAQAGTADPFTSSPLFAESEHHASAVFVVAVGARQRYCPFRNQPLIPRMCVSSTPFDAPPRPFGEPPASSPAYSAHVNNVRARASTSPSLLRSALCCNMANQNKSETSSVVTRVSSDTQATLTCETASTTSRVSSDSQATITGGTTTQSPIPNSDTGVVDGPYAQQGVLGPDRAPSPIPTRGPGSNDDVCLPLRTPDNTRMTVGAGAGLLVGAGLTGIILCAIGSCE